MKKYRPSLGDCAVRPLSKEMHGLLLSSYLMWPFIIVTGLSEASSLAILGVFVSFIVLGFFFYNLLVALVQMAHDMKKRLRISQWIFFFSLSVLVVRITW
jgi:hypothetical protein